MNKALGVAGLEVSSIDIVNTHATSTPQGDIQECEAVRAVFGDSSSTYINNTKSYIGHSMGAAGALELAGNIPSFDDGVIHPTINVDDLDDKCALDNLVVNEAKQVKEVRYILNNSFGMFKLIPALILKKNLKINF